MTIKTVLVFLRVHIYRPYKTNLFVKGVIRGIGVVPQTAICGSDSGVNDTFSFFNIFDTEDVYLQVRILCEKQEARFL